MVCGKTYGSPTKQTLCRQREGEREYSDQGTTMGKQGTDGPARAKGPRAKRAHWPGWDAGKKAKAYLQSPEHQRPLPQIHSLNCEKYRWKLRWKDRSGLSIQSWLKAAHVESKFYLATGKQC